MNTCEMVYTLECPFRDEYCHRGEEGCAFDEWLEEHPEYLADGETLRICSQEDIDDYADWLRSDE